MLASRGRGDDDREANTPIGVFAPTQAEAAKMLNVGTASVQRAKKKLAAPDAEAERLGQFAEPAPKPLSARARIIAEVKAARRPRRRSARRN